MLPKNKEQPFALLLIGEALCEPDFILNILNTYHFGDSFSHKHC